MTVLKQRVLSAYYICCIFSIFPQTNLFMLDNAMNPDQTAPRQSDLGPYRLQYRSQTLI